MQRLTLQRLLCFISVVLSAQVFAQDPIAYTVMGPEGKGVLRWLTSAPTCPMVKWDHASPSRMNLRVKAGTVPTRPSLQADKKPAQFDLNTCEAQWPKNVQSARIENQVLQAPAQQFHRIVILGDTGCRMKASENAFQDCNDASAWPFARIAAHAAKKSPDLVVHLGDIHYRESPCPADQPGCQNSPWGYGSDAWTADLFTPAEPLLKAAPWLFVRGNHESCARAGQGWFRFIEPRPWDASRACDLAEHDALGDFTSPFAVPFSKDAQFVVFDSSATSGKPLPPESQMFKTYQRQLDEVKDLQKNQLQSIFLSHHPLLAVAPVRDKPTPTPGGNKGLLSVFEASYGDALLPPFIHYLMHGHIHVFEVMNFKSAHPSSLVMGNSGSMMEGAPPAQLPLNFEVAPQAIVGDYASQDSYGFALLEIPEHGRYPWTLSEFDTQGQRLITCTLAERKATCKR